MCLAGQRLPPAPGSAGTGPELPVVQYPPGEDPVRLALRTQENDESVQPWDFLGRAFLVRRLYEELGTQERAAERLGWDRSNVSRHLTIANLPEECVTVIRNSVTPGKDNTGTTECDHGHRQSLDDIWSVRWFRHMSRGTFWEDRFW